MTNLQLITLLYKGLKVYFCLEKDVFLGVERSRDLSAKRSSISISLNYKSCPDVISSEENLYFYNLIFNCEKN